MYNESRLFMTKKHLTHEGESKESFVLHMESVNEKKLKFP